MCTMLRNVKANCENNFSSCRGKNIGRLAYNESDDVIVNTCQRAPFATEGSPKLYEAYYYYNAYVSEELSTLITQLSKCWTVISTILLANLR